MLFLIGKRFLIPVTIKYIVISKRKNSCLGNCDFKEKKEKYLKSRIDAFNGSKVFIEGNDKWTVDVLKDRQAKNIKMLVDNKSV